MLIDFLLERFLQNEKSEAIVWKNQSFTYQWLFEEVAKCNLQLEKNGIKAGAVVELYADFSPKAIALLLALIEMRCIIVPTTVSIGAKRFDFLNIAQVQLSLTVSAEDVLSVKKVEYKGEHPLYAALKSQSKPGLVLFSSGSSGFPKAALHDFSYLLEKFKVLRNKKRIINFLLFDHIGGINTLLHTLSNGGCVVTLENRNADYVAEVIEKFKVNVLPTSPTFINLLLLSGSHLKYDLSSLELITYGTEVMPTCTLNRLNRALPQVKISQTYGLSEIGIMRTKSKSSDSVYMQIGGEGFATRIVEGLLEVKAHSAMLGYLNAESPFTNDGWFKTGDAVEIDGEYLKILGRKSEMINVGGEKVYPAEVESVIESMPFVKEVAVTGEVHSILGQIVKARVSLTTEETLSDFKQRLSQHCKNKLAAYKIPQKILLVKDDIHNARFKKIRHQAVKEV